MISPRDAFGAHSTPEGGRRLGVMGYGEWGMGNSGLEAPSTGHREGGMGYGLWGMGDGKRGEIKREENMKTKPNTMQKKGKTEIYDDILEKSA